MLLVRTVWPRGSLLAGSPSLLLTPSLGPSEVDMPIHFCMFLSPVVRMHTHGFVFGANGPLTHSSFGALDAANAKNESSVSVVVHRC